MELSLLKEGDPRLNLPGTSWDFEKDGDPTELVAALCKTLLASGGVGLAATQCDVQKNIFVMGNFTSMFACINPQIVSLSPEVELDLEGCLSFPDLWLRVKRNAKCTVRFQAINGTVEETELTGLMARVFLHELDHLYGVTFDERSGELSLKMAKNKRIKDSKKKIRV